MRFEIKENCYCGAEMGYTEEIDAIHFSKILFIQSEFHKAHKSCKLNAVPIEKLEEIPDEK